MEIEVSLHVQVGEFVESKNIQRGVPSLSWNAFDNVLKLERECHLHTECLQKVLKSYIECFIETCLGLSSISVL